jgi:hypothetical protein
MVESKSARAALRDFLVSDLTPAAFEERALFEEAGRQGLLGLLAAVPGFLARLGEDVRAQWRASAQRLLVRGVHQLALARRVRESLAGAALRSLPLKGAAVAERLYSSVAERPMADVDVLVLDDPAGAVRLLEGEAFAVVERADHALALREAKSGGIVELHLSLTSCPGLFPLDREGMWARREVLSGTVVEAPSPADLLVSLSLHAAFQHGFGLSLVQFLDFRRLLERARPEPGEVLEVAGRARAEGAVLLALAAARAVVAAEPPPDLQAALEAKVSRSLRHRARALETRGPLLLVAPQRPSLAAARLALAEGRRGELLRRTLLPEPWPGGPKPRPARAVVALLARAGRLSRREAGRVLAAEASEDDAALRPAAEGAVSEAVETVDAGAPRAAALLREGLSTFGAVRFRVTGDCMSPGIAPGEEVLVVATAERRPRFGDVVLVATREGLRLHRLVFAFRERLRTKGDRAPGFDGPRRPGDALGTVLGVKRGQNLVPVFSPARAMASLVRGLAGRARRVLLSA